MLLVYFVDHGDRIPWWAGLDPIAIDIKSDLMIRPTDRPYGIGRNQDVFAEPPVAGVDDEIADVPIHIVDEEVLGMTDLAVGRVDMIALDL